MQANMNQQLLNTFLIIHIQKEIDTDKTLCLQSCYMHYLNNDALNITNVNVNVYKYSLISSVSSVDFTIYTANIGTLYYTVSSPLRRIQHLRTLLEPVITI